MDVFIPAGTGSVVLRSRTRAHNKVPTATTQTIQPVESRHYLDEFHLVEHHSSDGRFKGQLRHCEPRSSPYEQRLPLLSVCRPASLVRSMLRGPQHPECTQGCRFVHNTKIQNYKWLTGPFVRSQEMKFAWGLLIKITHERGSSRGGWGTYLSVLPRCIACMH